MCGVPSGRCTRAGGQNMGAMVQRKGYPGNESERGSAMESANVHSAKHEIGEGKISICFVVLYKSEGSVGDRELPTPGTHCTPTPLLHAGHSSLHTWPTI